MHTPIYEAVKGYINENPTVFHMPGHKLGKGLPKDFLRDIPFIDLTEIPGTDNLHFPQGAIKEAQQLAAQAFGADETFFLVNGSTCGIHAIIMGICKRGSKLVVNRDCHRSVINGMMLAGVTPVYIKPEFNYKYDIPEAILPSEVEKVLKDNPDAVGVLLTRPSYYGVCSDIEKIAQIVHSYGKIMAVDEAHGSHLKFSSSLPISAMEAGADICVQSAHKTLPAFTQGAYLHVKSTRIDIEKIKFYLQMIQTSSPSYIIMASLDIARAIAENDGKRLLENLLIELGSLESELNSSKGLLLLKENDLKSGSLDRTRVVINVRNLGKPGFEIDRLLRKEYGIQVEMSDFYNLVCITTIADERKNFKMFSEALTEIANRFKDFTPLADNFIREMEVPVQDISLTEVPHTKGTSVKFYKAAGKTSLQAITPYPPGIPVICQGEIITDDAIEYIHNIMNFGGVVNGLTENDEIIVAE